MRGSVICRGHAQVCTISAASGRLLPVVPWDGEERACGAGRFHRHLPNKDCRGTSVPVAESIETGRGTTPKDVDSAAPQASIDRGEVYPARMPRQTARSFSRRQGSKQRDGRQAGLRLSVMTLPLLVPVRCFFCLPLLPPWQHSMALRCGRRCAARRLRFLLRGPRSALDAQWKNIHSSGSRSPYACAVSAPFDFMFEIGCISDANSSSCIGCRFGPPYSSIDCLCVC
ncbi:hypothetical protein TCDM_09063 [Trypanosoma cruzi Dm28c]|uniref:Uncharacterized protein n=1 Tax=Trypanosoma cruzi Dm28c TaxID=1416333 RepID=V5AQZ8_TRYCR|nr:hypothetical protein TCDM_09063 [Trypanosoma cruzi Dm28c]